MKKVFLLAAMAILGIQAQAQIVSSRSAITTTTVTDESTGWETLGIEVNPSKFSYDEDSESFTSVAVTWTKAYALSKSTPLFLELGAGAQYSFYSKDDYKINYGSLKVPVNLIYDFKIPGTKINIDPFAGLKFRLNVLGEAKDEYYDISYKLFKSDEGDWKRFQAGWNIGVKARFNKIAFVGISYGTDFNEIADDIKVNEFSLSAGFVF